MHRIGRISRLVHAGKAGPRSGQDRSVRLVAFPERAREPYAGDPDLARFIVRGHQAGSADRARQTFWPPKPNEFDSTVFTAASRFTLATTSSGTSGSGMS